MKNLSIIVDWGCPFDCWFCIADSQKTKEEVNYNRIGLLTDLEDIWKRAGTTRISVSGGGEPLCFHSKEVKEFLEIVDVFCAEREIEFSIQTNQLKLPEEAEDFLVDKYVISVNEKNYKKKYQNWNEVNRDIRFTHVSDGNDLELIQDMIINLPKRAQFTVKQMDGVNDCFFKGLEDFLGELKDDRVRFLASGDYNLYYNQITRKTYTCYKEMLKEIK